jgi:hypothetical protein
MGQNQAKPRGALALIFGIIAAYLVIVFVFQLSDLGRAEAAGAGTTAADLRDVDNPATLTEGELWVALAVAPVDARAVRARRAVWSSTRESIHTGMLVCLLIFLSVPPIYLFDTWVPFIVGTPITIGIALYKSVGLLASGGGLDQVYDRAGEAMAPLGLDVAERPTVTIEPKGVAPYRMGPAIHGALELRGERHGREVTVRMPSGEGVRAVNQVRVAAAAPPFKLRSSDGRVKPDDAAPAAVREALRAVPASTRWKNLKGKAADGAIFLERKGSSGGDWLLDLWLAERLADAAGA